ncbi:MAG: DUF3800 domain-containing protein [Tepidisphaeraceae bacterium]|jgi:hypothetical protein
MHLVYLDESGNSGRNLNDQQQPVFLLCAMVVDESKWQLLEAGLKAVLSNHIPNWSTIENFEVHGADLRRGGGQFAGMSVPARIAFRDAWMSAGAQVGVRLIARTIEKKAYSKWLASAFGSGVWINPHVAAFALLSRCVNNYLKSRDGSPLGIFISDDNKEVAADVEKSIRVLRVAEGEMRLSQIVEKGFFVDSRKSLPLQLCDLFALSLRKASERMLGLGQTKSFDDSGIMLAESILFRDNKGDLDVIQWLTDQQNSAKK